MIAEGGERMPKSMRAEPSVLVWLRDDLRLDDNPALVAALAEGRPVHLLFVLDEVSPGLRPLGGAARWWLHHSLEALGRDVGRLGGRLILRRGPAAIVVGSVIEETGAVSLHWNRRRGAGPQAIDSTLKADLTASGLTVTSHLADLLHEPSRFVTGSGTPYRVFTPFWRALGATWPPRAPLPRPERMTPVPAEHPAIESDRLDDWELLPRSPDWSGGIAERWRPGEAGAAARLAAFLDEGIFSYSSDRDRPDLDRCSHLSPHLRFGEISVHRIVAAVEAARRGARAPSDDDIAKFFSELGWREFSHHQLARSPDFAHHNVDRRFDRFPWIDDEAALRAWRRGRTGYPLVDAGLRELWATGTMHNRVRMVVASFLVKHLLQDWRGGEAWFWDTLVDACPAANPANWQWVAGSGADAAPYFRIFNPVTQGEKFDPQGDYVRQWVPELARLPNRFVHAPWTAPRDVLAAAEVRLGDDYPQPIVEHARARARALDAFAEMTAS